MSNETKTNPYGLSDAQVAALRCVHADAAGAYQYAIRDGNDGSENGHDWKAHRQSVEDLEDAFPRSWSTSRWTTRRAIPPTTT